jgi:hypothetical protein
LHLHRLLSPPNPYPVSFSLFSSKPYLDEAGLNLWSPASYTYIKVGEQKQIRREHPDLANRRPAGKIKRIDLGKKISITPEEQLGALLN